MVKIRNALIGAAAFALVGVAGAADYYFSVPREIVTVAINPDSSIWIDYQITFTNSTIGKPIDVVDIGFPSDDYELSSVVADMDGVRLTDIRESEYIDCGVEVHLATGGKTIMPGASGTLHVLGLNRRMVYEDDDDKAYASCVFSPTWFGSEFTTGTTHLTVVFVFPPGVTGDQTRYHANRAGAPTQSYIQDGRVYYVWENPAASPSTQYFFGVSFPRSAVSEVRSKPRFKWLFDLIAGLIAVLVKNCLCLTPIAFIVGLIIVGSINQRRRMMKYLPPRVKVEGVGIKRGLTAPEAALIMEQPLNRVLTLIMYGLIKKGALSVVSQEPLKLKPQPVPANGLRPYEKAFLAAIEDDGDLRDKDLRKLLMDMIKGVEEKMKGFSHKETVAYYRSIIDTAWKMVATAATPEVKMEEFSNGLEWAMLDEKFDERTREVFTGVNVPLPYWWHFATPSTGGSGQSASVPGGGMTMPTLPGASFASGIVGQVEGFAHGVVGKVEAFTRTITAVTNPPPVSTSSGRSGGGYHSSCACACACAGCACACAGGGR